MFSLKDEKAPTADRYNAMFFKKAWSIIGDDVIAWISFFFSSGAC